MSEKDRKTAFTMSVMKRKLAKDDGQVNLKEMKKELTSKSEKDVLMEYGYPKAQLLKCISQLKKYDKDKDGKISSEEWNNFVNGKLKTNFVEKYQWTQIIIPGYYTLDPPPVFIPAICLLQILFYLLSNYAGSSIGSTYTDNHDSKNDFLNGLGKTPLIYHPCKREEIWRFFTYMLLHADPIHLGFNVGLQLLVGIPLEMEQPGWLGSLRVAGLFMSGVVVGSLGSGIMEQKFAVGSSAGTYALIMAHFASLILNWEEENNVRNKLEGMFDDEDVEEGQIDAVKKKKGYSFKVPFYLNPVLKTKRFLLVFLFMFIDASLTLKNVIRGEEKMVSRAAHLFGAATGLLLGVFILKNRVESKGEKKFQIAAFILFLILVAILGIWHIAGGSQKEDSWFNQKGAKGHGIENCDNS